MIIGASVVLVSASALLAQTNIDAYRLSNETFIGSARYQALGGAMGALGGDLSGLKQNPAGLALMQRSEIQFSFNSLLLNTSAQWYNQNTTSGLKWGKTGSGLSQFAISGTIFNSSPGSLTSVSLSFGVNPRHAFSRNFKAYSGGETLFSLADYAAELAYSTPEADLLYNDKTSYNPYANPSNSWLSVLGYNAFWFNTTDKPGVYETTYFYPNAAGELIPVGPLNSSLQLFERGNATDYDFHGGLNWDDRIYLGGGLKITSYDYRMTSLYDEEFTERDESGADNLTLDNELVTRGVGLSASVGLIVRASDYLRLGVAYHSPSWMNLIDRYVAQAGSVYHLDDNGDPLPEDKWEKQAFTPEDAFTRHRMVGPGKVVVSAAGIMGQYGLLSADLELTNHRGINLLGSPDAYSTSNNIIRQFYKPVTVGIKVGAEVKPSRKTSLRLGFNYRQSPIQKELVPQADKPALVAIAPAGTVPHYDLEGAYLNYAGGFGIRLSPRWYVDCSLVYGVRNYSVYPFSSLFDANGNTLVESPAPIMVKQAQWQTGLTIGYRF